MIRFVYRSLLRLHPPYFRRRFGPEMLAIFDLAQGAAARVRLLADVGLSLVRQWVLRPEFWHERPPAPAACEGAPSFFTFANSRPRTGALLDGAMLSLAVFAFVYMAIDRGGNHPVPIPLPRDFFGNEWPAPVATPREAPPVPVSEEARSRPAVSERAISPSERLLPFVGTYIAEGPEPLRILVTLAGARLQLDMPGSPRMLLARVSENEFLAVGSGDCRVRFTRRWDGTASELDLDQGGSHLRARRQ